MVSTQYKLQNDSGKDEHLLYYHCANGCYSIQFDQSERNSLYSTKQI